MKKRQTTPQVIAKFIKKHGNKYDYSKVVFIGSHTKVTIICPDHGEFTQTPAIHLRGSGCPTCGKILKGKKKRIDNETIIERFREVHGYRYDYTPTIYSTNRNKVTINCIIHGAFDILPSNHLKGSGCALCALHERDKKIKEYDPIADFIKVHGDRYDYSRFIYTGSNKKGEIICPDHGSFYQSHYVHKHGHGCPACGLEKSSQTHAYNQDEIIARFKDIHGDRYDYSNLHYTSLKTPVTITCPIHGDFQQRPTSHINGRGCHVCGHIKAVDVDRKSTEWFINKAKSLYGDRYDYALTTYTGMGNPIDIKCLIHGIFNIEAGDHIYGAMGCPSCSNSKSIDESLIGDYLEELGITVIRKDHSLISPKMVDIYLPEYHVGIEYCILHQHGQNHGKGPEYHKEKMDLLNQLGIELITIFEDEWLSHPSVVKSILRNRFGLSARADSGRNLSINEITPRESRDFLSSHHIQGGCTGSVHIGAYTRDGLLVGVMVMGPPTRQTSSYEWELKRYAGDGSIRVGLMSKLFQYFIRKYNPESIVSFSDLRWFSGASYVILGFFKNGIITPDYYYTKGEMRYNKSKFRKSGIRRYHPEIYNEALTEKVMMNKAGYDRIWDCGKVRYVWYRELH